MASELRVLEVRVDCLDLAGVMEAVCRAVEENRRLRLITANPEIICRTLRDFRLQQILESADIVTPDGIGVVWASRRLGQPLRERVTGIDLALWILAEAQKRKWRVFFLGGKPGVAQKAAEVQKARFPAAEFAFAHGYFTPEEEDELQAIIRQFHPHILLAGLGAPRQEYWLSEHSGLANISLGVGGSLDVLSGQVQRAPEWVQRMNLEWLHRLLKEPQRLKRQLILPVFVWRVLRQTWERRH